MKNKIILTIILSIVILILSGCVNGSTTPNIPDQGDDINHKPIISDLPASPRTAFINQNITITCTASDQDGDTLAYSWSSSPGGTINGIGSNIIWKAPATKGTYTITCLVSDGKGGEDSKSLDITVASDSGGVRYPISWSKAKSNGWKNPLGEGKELITSTAYDYDSGIYLNNHPGIKHMGVDIVSEKNDKVYAIADGIVKHVFTEDSWYDKNGILKNRSVIIIKHTNSNNEVFFAIYGHVFARSDLEVNSEVKANENKYLGVVKKSGTPCHLHFGVNLSTEFVDDLLAGKCGWGFIPESANPSEYDWIDPIDYLNTHSIENIVLGSYTITASAGPNGSISPSGNVTVNQGSNKSFTITSDTGYSIDNVLVDGISVGAVSLYTFTNVTEDHTISATFLPVSIEGTTGKIAFASYRDGDLEIYVMNADGSNQANITNDPGWNWDPCFSPDGTKIAFTSNRDGGWKIYVMNADGSNQTRLTKAGNWDPCFSSDGTKIAFISSRDGNGEIYVMNADGSNQTRVTNNQAGDLDPCFSPDGTKIAFESDLDVNCEIYVMNADGSNQTRLTNDGWNWDPCFSPDGTKIAFTSCRDVNCEIYVMNADGSNQTNITNNGWNWDPCFSPDGTKIAFKSGRDGNGEIYVMNADGSNQTRLTNDPANDYREPSWAL